MNDTTDKAPPRPSWAIRLRQLLSPGEEPGASGRRAFLRSSAAAAVALPAAALLGGSAARAADDGVDDFTRFGNDFRSVRTHEQHHVDFLVKALGANARPEPTFKNLEQRTVRQFVFVSQALENTGCGAYVGAAPFILDRGILADTATIALIEGRHAGWLNDAVGDPITGGRFNNETDRSFEQPFTPDDVGFAIASFVEDLNGGPAVTYSTNPSAENDIAILNFALALEYLEARFYETNVPQFYRKERRN